MLFLASLLLTACGTFQKAAVTTLAGTARSTGPTDGTGSAELFNYPHGITTDGTSLYVTDSRNHTLRRIQ